MKIIYIKLNQIKYKSRLVYIFQNLFNRDEIYLCCIKFAIKVIKTGVVELKIGGLRRSHRILRDSKN